MTRNKNQKTEHKFFIFMTIIILFITLGATSYIMSMNTKLERRKSERLAIENSLKTIHEEIKTEVKSEVKEIKKEFEPQYTIIENENNIQRIFVPLGLNKDFLKKNLLHAANAFQKNTNSPNVIIFAYRSDDLKHEDFTAGKCTITKGSEPIFEFAKVYFIHQPKFDIGEKVLINKANTPLYKENNLKKMLQKLNKGLQASVLEFQRTFSTDEILDIYRIEFYIKKKKITGWVLGDNLRVIEKIERSSRPSNSAIYNPNLYTWRNFDYYNKMATCSEFLLKCQRKGILKIKISSLNLLDRSSDLVLCVDSYIKGIRYERQYLQDFEDIAMVAMLLLNWVK